MPWKSKAQMRKFGVLAAEGKISEATFNKWAKEKGKKKLPERVKKKKK